MLSDRHQAVLDFIIGYKETNDGISPSIREISESFGGKSNSTSHISWILNKLRNRGLIRFEPGQARTIQVVGGKWIFEGNGETKTNG